MSYGINYDLDEFIAQIASGSSAIYIQPYQTIEYIGATASTITSQVLVSAVDAHATVHGCRIVIEHASLAGDKNAVHDAVAQRADVAVSFLRAAMPRTVMPGKLLEAGMHEDIKTTVATHNLWRWSNDTHDPVKRTLVRKLGPGRSVPIEQLSPDS